MISKLLLLGAALTAQLVAGTPLPTPKAKALGRRTLPEPVSASEALSLLADLTVAVESNSPAYVRDNFSDGWKIISGRCDARETVIKRDGTDVETAADCKATSGTWYSVYDGIEVTQASRLDIDHMVPLKEAWVSGARRWNEADLEAFANDVERPQLLAVSLTTNRAKGDKDPAEWLPPLESYHCTYVRAWVTVKSHYELSVDAAEKAKLQEVLEGCPGADDTSSSGGNGGGSGSNAALRTTPMGSGMLMLSALLIVFSLI